MPRLNFKSFSFKTILDFVFHVLSEPLISPYRLSPGRLLLQHLHRLFQTFRSASSQCENLSYTLFQPPRLSGIPLFHNIIWCNSKSLQ